MDQDGFRCNQVLQRLEGVFLGLAPVPFYIFSREIIKGLCMICEVSYEDAIKVAKTEEGLNVFDLGWHWPVLDTGNFDGVHASHPPSKDYPQVIHFWRMEKALVQGEEEVVGSGNM